MQPLAADTSIEMERRQAEIWASLPLGRRAEIVADLCWTARALALAGDRVRRPHGPADDARRWAELTLGSELAARVFADLATLPASSRAT